MKKRSGEYWKDRFLNIEKASNAYGVEAFRQIEPAFDEAQRAIQREIERWYSRYAKNNQISITEARKALTTKELKELRWDVNEYIKKGRENAFNGRWIKELENASARVHISRLEALKIRIQQAAEVAFGNELDVIDDMARNVYTEDYYHSVYEMQKGFNIGWDIGTIDQNKLDKLIVKPWTADNKTFADRIWQTKNQMVSELHKQLTMTCVLGKAPDEAIKALIKYVDKDIQNKKYVAGRLVMTEQAYFHSVAQRDAFNDLDVEEFEIVATLDSHTSQICQDLDGTHLPMSQYEPGVTAPPFHVFCRSVTVPYFEDNFTGERAARDVETGETYYVPDDMTYKEWKQSQDELYGAGTVDKKRKMVYNESADKAQFERYKARLGGDAPKRFTEFQKIKYNMADEYANLTELYAYKGRVPEATVKDFECYKAIKALGEKGVIRVPPLAIDVSGLAVVNDHAFNHGCTLDDAKEYITSAKCTITRSKWDGKHINYYSLNGATYLNEECKVNTIFSKDDFDPKTKKIVEVFR